MKLRFELDTERFPEPCQFRGSGMLKLLSVLSMYPTMWLSQMAM